ncbi:MAG: branched-chain amino acid ABC transporter permease [Ktedonobacteraceae bacterium]|nr:branched-chain amino acid ABC transporter permease [Ktedonobacteraceae bacterium]
MSTSSLGAGLFKPAGDTRALLVKWLVALLVPVLVFTFAWAGESIINNSLLVIFGGSGLIPDIGTAIQAAVFILLFYATIIALAGYMVAADSGRRGVLDLWLSVFIFVMIPLLMMIVIGNLIIGLTASIIIWGVYFLVRRIVRRMTNYTAPSPIDALKTNNLQPSDLLNSARLGGFWFATLLAIIWLVVDLIFFFSGSLPPLLLIWVIIRTLVFPVAGYFLGQLGGVLALRRSLVTQSETNAAAETASGSNGTKTRVSKRQQLRALSASRANEEAKDLVPNDLPFRSKGAQRFYMILLAAFVLFYPAIDPLLFGYGSNGRLSGYGDAGYYVILALGLNIVVGFAGLLDLGYVAFFAIGSYAWGLVGSTQFQTLTGVIVNPQVWPWFFWPMLLGGALIAALWGVVLGAPTLRLRGDYLAIVTLGFGEIVPIIFLELDKYTNGTNGVVGVYSPKFPGVSNWSSFTPIPYYYLILVLIGVLIFVNIRLRDSRLGRAWIAIREDEIAAASSGINLSRTKLFAFGAGAFFSGIAGVYHAAKLGGVTPDDFNYSDSIIYLAMVVIGGLGSIPGVIVGALVVYSINLFVLTQLDTLAGDPGNPLHIITQLLPNFTFDSIRNLIFGSILVIVMIFRPEGLIPSARRRRELHHTETDAPEEGSLDVPPGAAGFESEIRVE